MPTFKADFDIEAKVYIDKQEDMLARVSEVAFRSDGKSVYVLYQVEWLHNGVNYAAYMAGWRLTSAAPK